MSALLPALLMRFIYQQDQPLLPLHTQALPTLPISEVLEQINSSLNQHRQLVLEAPPGAGKTTLVPLSVLQHQQQCSGWLQNQSIVMLEPRRMAAKTVANRMAALLGESVGDTVGYRVRQDTKISKATRIEVITEGILTRKLLHDPALEDVGLLIFDEFHERSLEADMGLALALQCNALLRDDSHPLRIMVMSATLDGESVASVLEQAPVIRSHGKMFPVQIHQGQHQGYDDDIIDATARTVKAAVARHSGNILVFLPGQREITAVMKRLSQSLPAAEQATCKLLPLYGALPYQQQQLAIDPLPAARQGEQAIRKIVLATDIAETSLTIEGITIVVDSGLCRQAYFDLGTGMSRLKTRRISKDSSIQRMGRAGRTAPGHCYRLWSEEQHYQLAQRSSAEILQADLTPLTLYLLAWGIDDINELSWLDNPPAAAIAQALDLLAQLGAITPRANNTDDATDNSALCHWQLSAQGQLMATMPVHPRLAHMLLCAAAIGQQEQAGQLAALLSERNPPGQQAGADLSQQQELLSGQRHCPRQHQHWLSTVRRQAATLTRLARQAAHSSAPAATVSEADSTGYLLACAYPDRLARRKAAHSKHYQLSNGRQATLKPADPLVNQEWLAVAELAGGHATSAAKASHDRIMSAVAFNPALFEGPLHYLLQSQHHYDWHEPSERFIAECHTRVGKLLVSSSVLTTIPTEIKNAALLALIRKRGLKLLPWSEADQQWLARVRLLHRADASHRWPDVSDQQLLDTLEHWLQPYLNDISKLAELKRLNLSNLLANLLPWPLPQRLDELAPVRLQVPSGSTLAIDYSQTPPILKVKLQEMFGCQSTPTVANGAVPLMLHLLSPAGRPLQITQDLGGFWRSSYREVQKDMKGRYPKHPWPDDPLQALPTRYTKRRR